MSAAEKLKALDGAMTAGVWVHEHADDDSYGNPIDQIRVNGPAPYGQILMWPEECTPKYVANLTAVVALRNALPQIVAVVEAAEQVAIQGKLADALAALDDALGDVT